MFVSPQTHSHLYNQVEIVGFKFFVRKEYGVGAQEKVNDRRELDYLESHPNYNPATDTEEYAKWCDSKDGIRSYNRAFVSVAFIPDSGSPEPLDLYEFIPRSMIDAALGFTTPQLEASTTEPQTSNDFTAGKSDTTEPSSL